MSWPAKYLQKAYSNQFLHLNHFIGWQKAPSQACQQELRGKYQQNAASSLTYLRAFGYELHIGVEQRTTTNQTRIRPPKPWASLKWSVIMSLFLLRLKVYQVLSGTGSWVTGYFDEKFDSLVASETGHSLWEAAHTQLQRLFSDFMNKERKLKRETRTNLAVFTPRHWFLLPATTNVHSRAGPLFLGTHWPISRLVHQQVGQGQ